MRAGCPPFTFAALTIGHYFSISLEHIAYATSF
jgi:hypothetical protein